MKSKIKRAAELRMTLSQRRWGPAKRVTGATYAEDEAPRERENFDKQSVILRSDWCNITRSLV